MKEPIRAGITASPLVRTALLVIVCAATLVLPGKSAFSQNWYNSSWLYRQGITIDSDNVDFSLSGSLSQFPVLISLTDGSNSLFGNAQPDGDDILFTASDGHTKIPHEIQAYDDTGGSEELLAWVRVPTFNNGSNTVIYMYYGNASASSQETPSSVWDSSFKGVWHLEESAADDVYYIDADPAAGDANKILKLSLLHQECIEDVNYEAVRISRDRGKKVFYRRGFCLSLYTLHLL